MFVATVTEPLRPCLGNDRGLALVLLGVEHLVTDPALGQLLGEVLALLDAGGADEDGLAGLVLLGDVVHHGVELGDLVLVDQVLLVPADHRLFVGIDTTPSL
jgi:hypothetical protein